MSIKEFIETYPLYKAISIEIGEANPLKLDKLTYNSNCPLCESQQTFILQLCYDRNDGFGKKIERIAKGDFKSIMSFDSDRKYNDFQVYDGICQHCKNYKENYLLQTTSDKPEPVSYTHGQIPVNYLLRKTGQYPPFSIEPNREIAKFITQEDNEYYKKALMNLSASYGIGAFAYFRRIAENQIKHICQSLSEIDFPGASGIKQALEKYEANHQMSNLIEEVFQYLPESLKQLGNNPLQLLYDQLSGGIHEFTDDECFEKAKSIDILLNHIIKTVNQEMTMRTSVIQAIKTLTKS